MKGYFNYLVNFILLNLISLTFHGSNDFKNSGVGPLSLKLNIDILSWNPEDILAELQEGFLE